MNDKKDQDDEKQRDQLDGSNNETIKSDIARGHSS